MTATRPPAHEYTIYFVIGGKKYYMVWDAWVEDDDGTWHLLTSEQMARAFESFVRENEYIHVSRGPVGTAVFHASSIDEWEVIDGKAFQFDI